MNNKNKNLIESFYFIDLIKNLFKSKNYMALVYLALNITIIALFPTFIGGDFYPKESFGMVCFYFIVAMIAISPIGEAILRFQQGCREITDIPTLNRLEPLFMEVKERALKKHTDMNVSDDIDLYIVEDDDINAFALGRKTICVTRGLLQCSDDQIKAVIGHEFGHIVTHDTDLILLITVGNFLITAIVTFFRIMIAIAQLFFGIICAMVGNSEGALASVLNTITSIAITIFVDCVMWVWTKIGVLLVMKSSRNAEYEADAFSCDLGYSDGLVSFLKSISPNNCKGSGIKDKAELFAVLESSHPRPHLRVERITNFANQNTQSN